MTLRWAWDDFLKEVFFDHPFQLSCVWFLLDTSHILFIYLFTCLFLVSSKMQGFPGGSDSKESAYNVGDLGSIPGLGRSPGEGNGNPLQFSGLENPLDRGAWRATVRGVRVGHDWTTLTLLHFLKCKLGEGRDPVGSLFFRKEKKVKVLVAQSCPAPCDPMDCSLPGSSLHRILQVRILEWVTIPFPKGSSQPRDILWVSHHFYCVKGPQ